MSRERVVLTPQTQSCGEGALDRSHETENPLHPSQLNLQTPPGVS